jgi:hypothetical protein
MSNHLLTPEFCNLLENFDQETAAEAMSVLQDAAARRSIMHKKTVTSSFKIEKSKKRTMGKPLAIVPGPKRPLNRYMAFRSESMQYMRKNVFAKSIAEYYGGVLGPVPQSIRSKVLAAFWKNDYFQAQWLVTAFIKPRGSLTDTREEITVAYNEIRGIRTKEQVPLGQFLTICAPLIGIIPPGDYSAAMGWELNESIDGGDKVRLHRSATTSITADTNSRCHNSHVYSHRPRKAFSKASKLCWEMLKLLLDTASSSASATTKHLETLLTKTRCRDLKQDK